MCVFDLCRSRLEHLGASSGISCCHQVPSWLTGGAASPDSGGTASIEPHRQGGVLLGRQPEAAPAERPPMQTAIIL